MPYRAGARNNSSIFFCMVGIITLNSFAHNSFRGITNPIYTIKRLFGYGGTIRLDYEHYDIYHLLNGFNDEGQDMLKLKGVAVEGQILRQTAIDPTEINPNVSEKVGRSFMLSRRFAESPGEEENAKVLWVRVQFDHPEGLEPNMWVRVQGPVVQDMQFKTELRPMIRAVQVDEIVGDELEKLREKSVLTRHGESESSMPGLDTDEHGHMH